MKNLKRLWRTLLFTIVLAALCGSFAFPVVDVEVRAAPQLLIGFGDVVISEFRFRGSGGGSDEFIEIFNPTVAPINLNGWKLNGSNNSGGTSTRYTFTTDILLQPGQHYLLANINPIDGVTADATYGTGITPDGGIALLRPDNSIADAAGLSSGSAYKEGTVLASFTSDVDQSYERKLGGVSASCQDNDNNSSDFLLINPSGPQNLTSSATPCIGVTNVTSSIADGTYTAGAVIDVAITFSGVVTVSGTPTLLLETGATDRAATYVSGSGSASLSFSYTVIAGDTSGDLNYVSSNSLQLNGGTITGATGDAILTLPSPGSVGSLGTNKNIVIDNGLAPSVTIDQAVGQADPADTIPVNFTVAFSEPINPSTFTPSDVTQGGTASPVVWSITNSGDNVNFTLSATSVTQSNVTLIPSIAANQVMDLAGTGNTASTSTDNSVTFIDNTTPTVAVNQASAQTDPTGSLPIRFLVVFSEPIDSTTFTVTDITQTGTATVTTWTITDAGDLRTFTLQATAVTTAGTIIPSILAGKVTDLVGNNNVASTSTDNQVTYSPVVAQAVIINEVAWSGTAANSDDEWIELYNPGTAAINITGWQLYGDDNTVNKVGSPNFLLSGTIPAGGYFLLERNEQATTVTANQLYSTGDLVNSGERLYLKDASGSIIDTANLDGGAWPAGTASVTTTNPPAYASMERVGTTGAQWASYAGAVPVAQDRNGGAIKGTPGQANWIKTASITTITSDTPDPSVVNQNVTVVVTVMGGATTAPAGTVAITGANTNCTITLTGGTGSCAVKFTTAGSKTLTATYTSTSGLPASNDTESHQVSATAVFKTPTAVFVPAPPPPLIAINEFVPRPGHDWNGDGAVNVGDEYIELLNHGTIDVNLSGYRLDDEVNIGSNPYALLSKVLKPGERIVFYGSETGLLLSDGGDGVRLLKPNGQLMDAYNYSVAGYPDQSYCRLPDNGGADDWNQNCYPTPGFQNSLSGDFAVSPNTSEEPLCPIADTLPEDFVLAECDPFGQFIWRSEYWDRTGWYKDKVLPIVNGKWPVFAN